MYSNNEPKKKRKRAPKGIELSTFFMERFQINKALKSGYLSIKNSHITYQKKKKKRKRVKNTLGMHPFNNAKHS